MTKTVTLTTCEGTIDPLNIVISGTNADLFKVPDPPTSLGPFSSVQLAISYSPTALENRSWAQLVFDGSDGETSQLDLFGEPVGKTDGGTTCLPGGDSCTTVDADAGMFACCFGQCILDAGATVGVCPCFPGEDGGNCP